jgi:D-lactate dehydrogenase (cytochrome)
MRLPGPYCTAPCGGNTELAQIEKFRAYCVGPMLWQVSARAGAADTAANRPKETIALRIILAAPVADPVAGQSCPERRGGQAPASRSERAGLSRARAGLSLRAMNELPPASHAAAFARIRALLGERHATADPEALAPRLVEGRGLYRGRAGLLARPGSTEQTAALVAICAEHGVRMIPQGGATSLSGNAVPYEDFAGVIVSMERMDRIRALDPLNDTITVEAGVILADIQKAAAAADRLFPLSLGAEGTCRIGGNISTNAGGTAVLRYGNMRELTLGLEVVLPDGRVWHGLRALRKDNTGYDLKQLFIAGEGTLGIVTAAVLRLFPLPREKVTAIAGLANAAAAPALLARLRACVGDPVTSYEIMGRRGLDFAFAHIPGCADPFDTPYPFLQLIEVSSQRADGAARAAVEETLAAAIEDGLVADATIAQSLAQAQALWRLREGIVAGQAKIGASIKHDVAVPVSRVAEFIDAATLAAERALPGVRVVAFGHVGDGNIHFNLTVPASGWTDAAFLAEWPRMNCVVHDIAVGMDGTFSAEHGIGRLKRGELAHYRSETELSLMRAIKAALDPQGLMNPGKIL